MKRIMLFLFVLILLPGALRAQAIGQLHCDDRIFSTGLPENYHPGNPDYYDAETGEEYYVMMPAERRKTALECIEWTFGKVKEYKEWYNDCQGCHVLSVTLDSGDEFEFYNGRLTRYTIVSPRFRVGADVLRGGGLRVGQKLNLKKSRGAWKIKRDGRLEDEPGLYKFSPDEDDYYLSFLVVDENNNIIKIYNWTNDC